MSTVPTSGLWNRMKRAIQLDSNLFEEVEADASANRQALMVVVLSSVAAGVGTGIGGLIEKGPMWLLWGILIGLVSAIGGWLIWALLTYWIGTTLFKGPETRADYGQVLRTLGFANAPGIFRLLAFLPYIGGLVQFAASVWVLVAGVIAIRQALDFSTWRAIGTAIVGWLIYILLVFLLSAFLIGARTLA